MKVLVISKLIQLGAEHAIRINSGLNRVRAQSWFGPYGPSAGSLILALSCGSDLLNPFMWDVSLGIIHLK